jgi:steroid delta-isomerase-like uncharacterized protein
LSEPQTDSNQAGSAHAGSAWNDPATAHRRRLAVSKIMTDYRDDAIVNDPLFGKPLVGKAAIAVHKTAEMIALSDVEMDVTDRWTMGADLTATWEVTGVHSGPYYNLPATGKRIKITGATVVTRRDGKISVETLYYDADEMLRQLKGEAHEELDLPEPEELAAQGEAEFGPNAESEPVEPVQPEHSE